MPRVMGIGKGGSFVEEVQREDAAVKAEDVCLELFSVIAAQDARLRWWNWVLRAKEVAIKVKEKKPQWLLLRLVLKDRKPQYVMWLRVQGDMYMKSMWRVPCTGR